MLLAVAGEKRRAEDAAQQTLRLQAQLQEEAAMRQRLAEEVLEAGLECERLRARLAEADEDEEELGTPGGSSGGTSRGGRSAVVLSPLRRANAPLGNIFLCFPVET